MMNFVFPCAPSDLSLYVTGTFRNAYVDVTAGYVEENAAYYSS